eukprot:gene3253-6438_t
MSLISYESMTTSKEDILKEKKRRQNEYHAALDAQVAMRHSPEKMMSSTSQKLLSPPMRLPEPGPLPVLKNPRSLHPLDIVPQKNYNSQIAPTDDVRGIVAKLESIARTVMMNDGRITDLRDFVALTLSESQRDMAFHFDNITESLVKTNNILSEEQSSRLLLERSFAGRLDQLERRHSRDLEEMRSLLLSHMNDNSKVDSGEKKNQWDVIMAAERRSKEIFAVADEVSRNESKLNTDMIDMKRTIEQLRGLVLERLGNPMKMNRLEGVAVVDRIDKNYTIGGVEAPETTVDHDHPSYGRDTSMGPNPNPIPGLSSGPPSYRIMSIENELSDFRQKLLHMELFWKDSTSEIMRLQNNLNAERENLVTAQLELRSVLSAEINARRQQQGKDRENMEAMIGRFEGVFNNVRRDVKGNVEQLAVRTSSLESSLLALASGMAGQMDALQSSLRDAIGSLRQDTNALASKVTRCTAGQENVTHTSNDNFTRIIHRIDDLDALVHMKMTDTVKTEAEATILRQAMTSTDNSTKQTITDLKDTVHTLQVKLNSTVEEAATRDLSFKQLQVKLNSKVEEAATRDLSFKQFQVKLNSTVEEAATRDLNFKQLQDSYNEQQTLVKSIEDKLKLSRSEESSANATVSKELETKIKKVEENMLAVTALVNAASLATEEAEKHLDADLSKQGDDIIQLTAEMKSMRISLLEEVKAGDAKAMAAMTAMTSLEQGQQFLSGRIEVLEQIFNSGHVKSSSTSTKDELEEAKNLLEDRYNALEKELKASIKSTNEELSDLESSTTDRCKSIETELTALSDANATAKTDVLAITTLLSSREKMFESSMEKLGKDLQKEIETSKESMLAHTADLEKRILSIAKEEAHSIRKMVVSKFEKEEEKRDAAINANAAKLHHDIAEVLMDLGLGGNADDADDDDEENEEKVDGKDS